VAVKNSGWLIFEKLIRLFFGFFVTAFVARYLGPNQYGELAFVLAYLVMFQSFSVFGLDGIIVRDIALNRHSPGEILGSALAVRICAGVFCWCTAILIMAVSYGLESRNVILVILLGASLVCQAADTVDLWFQSQTQSRLTVVAKLIAYSLANILKIAFVIFKMPLIAFAAIIAMESIFVAISLYFVYKRFPSPLRWKIKLEILKSLIKEGAPFMAAGFSIAIYTRIDQLMIKDLLGNHELGVYAAVLPLATIWQFLPSTLVLSIAPFLATKKMESNAEYLICLQKVFQFFSLMGWIVCIPIALLSGVAVKIIYGDQYLSGGLVLAIYVFTNLFINLGIVQGMWIVNERFGYLSLYKTIIGAIFSIGGNYFLIPVFGIIGAAFSALLAQFVSAVLSNIVFAPKIFRMQIKALLKPRFTL
jgi:O-antigen/teichoic acid export membrane protein